MTTDAETNFHYQTINQRNVIQTVINHVVVNVDGVGKVTSIVVHSVTTIEIKVTFGSTLVHSTPNTSQKFWFDLT